MITPDDRAVQQRGGVVIVSGDALPLLYRAIIALAARHHRDGLAAPTLLHDACAALFRATVSPPRHEDDGQRAARSCCTCQDADDWISVAAAARLLALSRRQVQRLAVHDAGLLGARRIGSIWALQRSAVLALTPGRKASK